MTGAPQFTIVTLTLQSCARRGRFSKQRDAIDFCARLMAIIREFLDHPQTRGARVLVALARAISLLFQFLINAPLVYVVDKISAIPGSENKSCAA